MKVFIPSWARAETIRTHRIFKSATVVVHTKQEALNYIHHNPELKDRVVVSNAKQDAYGLTRQREFVCRNLVERDEWFLFCDDNIRYLRVLSDPWYNQERLEELHDAKTAVNRRMLSAEELRQICTRWRPRFRVACSEEHFFRVVAPDTIAFCEKAGARLAGFAHSDNVLFRNHKFSTCAYVIGKMMLWHNTLEVPFNHTISMEDFYHTAMNLKMFGVCVVNYFVFPKALHYEPGGMGSLEQRTPVRREDVRRLHAMFPGLFRERFGHNNQDQKSMGETTDLALRVSEQTIEVWRRRAQRRRLV